MAGRTPGNVGRNWKQDLWVYPAFPWVTTGPASPHRKEGTTFYPIFATLSVGHIRSGISVPAQTPALHTRGRLSRLKEVAAPDSHGKPGCCASPPAKGGAGMPFP